MLLLHLRNKLIPFTFDPKCQGFFILSLGLVEIIEQLLNLGLVFGQYGFKLRNVPCHAGELSLKGHIELLDVLPARREPS